MEQWAHGMGCTPYAVSWSRLSIVT